jgi:hypothetical protein
MEAFLALQLGSSPVAPETAAGAARERIGEMLRKDIERGGKENGEGAGARWASGGVWGKQSS